MTNAITVFQKQCEEKGWTFTTGEEKETVEGPEFSMSWRSFEQEGDVFNPDFEGSEGSFQEVMPLWTRYLKARSEETGRPGAWLKSEMHPYILSEGEVEVTIGPELCPDAVFPLQAVENGWMPEITAWAFIPAGNQGKQMLDAWQNLIPVLQEVVTDQREQDKQFYLSSVPHVSFQTLKELRIRVIMAIDYYTDGKYESMVFTFDDGPAVKMGKEERRSFGHRDELKAILTTHIEQSRKQSEVRNLLTPPRTEYDRVFSGVVAKKTSDALYDHLIRRHEPKWIEVYAREGGWIDGHHMDVGVEEERVLVLFMDAFVVVHQHQTTENIVYVGNDMDEAIHALTKGEPDDTIRQTLLMQRENDKFYVDSLFH